MFALAPRRKERTSVEVDFDAIIKNIICVLTSLPWMAWNNFDIEEIEQLIATNASNIAINTTGIK